jgi:hypothetical protein
MNSPASLASGSTTEHKQDHDADEDLAVAEQGDGPLDDAGFVQMPEALDAEHGEPNGQGVQDQSRQGHRGGAAVAAQLAGSARGARSRNAYAAGPHARGRLRDGLHLPAARAGV